MYASYRSPDAVPDKLLRRTVRAWAGYKTNVDGQYVNIELVNLKKEAEASIDVRKLILESQQSVENMMKLQGEKDNDDSEESHGVDVVGKDFVREKSTRE